MNIWGPVGRAPRNSGDYANGSGNLPKDAGCGNKKRGHQLSRKLIGY